MAPFTILQPEQFPVGERKIILTFDDGPNGTPGVSDSLLDVLAENEVKATFCYIGRNIESAPKIVDKAFTAGHQIALHTYHHGAASLLSQQSLIAETESCINLLQIILGRNFSPTLFRPPLGAITPAVVKMLREFPDLKQAYITTFINEASANPTNWKEKLETLKSQIQKANGGAIVLHEMRFGSQVDKTWLPKAVEDFIEWARKNNFEFTTYP